MMVPGIRYKRVFLYIYILSPVTGALYAAVGQRYVPEPSV